MDKAKRHIDEAYKLISAIPVKEDAVELMASAKQHLREAFAIIKDAGAKETRKKETRTEEVQDG